MHKIELVDKLKLLLRKPSAFFQNITIIDDFCYYNRINLSGVVIDVGCANYPQLGLYFAKRDFTVFLIDPTKKHKMSLLKFSQQFSNIFYIDAAIGACDGTMNFFESDTKISGSLLDSHRNASILCKNYLVEVLSIKTLLNRYNISKVSLLKLDLEGAEFELIFNSILSDWECVDQIYIEFHHHCTRFSYKDTLNCVEILVHFGFSFFKLHRDVFLFYRNSF
jgi:FkbM family methyltransferase